MTPETLAFFDAISHLAPVALEPEVLRARRRELARRFDWGPPEVRAEDGTRAGVPVRTYHPDEPAGPGVVVYVHGGGWVTGDVTTHDGICRSICSESGLTVVSVDYGRPPESPHPGPVLETLAVLASLASESSPGDVLALAGDSSGAHIAFEAALDWQARREPRALSRLLLIQPACDSTMSSPSWGRLGAGHFLTAAVMRWYWDLYLGAGGRSILWHGPLERVPSVRIIISSLDPSADEADTLGRHLREAGVPTIVDRIEGAPHGCLTLPGAFPSTLPHLRDASRWLAGAASVASSLRQPQPNE